MQEPRCFANESFDFSIFTCSCPSDKKTNEDSATIITNGSGRSLIAVADGLGGARGGSKASGIAIEKLNSNLKSQVKTKNDIRLGILDSFESANKGVLDLGIGAGTTLSVFETGQNYVRPYHVGDSLMMVVSQKGTIKYQNTFHSPVGYAIESGFINEKEALHHDERHIVSNIVGSSDMTIEVGPKIELSKKDTILVASDGLADNISPKEIAEHIRKGQILDASQALCEATLERMTNPKKGAPSKPDDLTFILCRTKN